MPNYNVKLTPDFIVPFSEGDLDTSIVDGKSIQRTFNMLEIENGSNRKMVSVKDGEDFDNVTFQNSSGVGTYSISFTFTADQILSASNSYDQNGFIGVAAVISLSTEQASSLNSFGYSGLLFRSIWSNGSYVENGGMFVFTPGGDNFIDVAIIISTNENLTPVCNNDAVWNMPVTTTEYILGFNDL